MPNRLLRLCAAACLAIVFMGCSEPMPTNRSISTALSLDEARPTALGQAITPLTDTHGGNSGIYPLGDPHDAFATRMLLARAAQRTLDIQYYIWHGDTTGTLLLEALHAAADRGVRVRLLLDDNGTNGLDTELAALNTHPNIEVRLFNPFKFRQFKPLGYLTDFARANRRMHNKSFTADSLATIIGGRNIGDEYFGAADNMLFSDLDVLAIGPVAQEVSNDFDLYWEAKSSWPVDSVLPRVDPAQLDALKGTALATERSPEATTYMKALAASPVIQKLFANELPMEWAPAKMVSDDPAKGQREVNGKQLLIHQLEDIIGKPARHVELVSSYFVPGANGVESFTKLVQQGVRVRILTNSLDATDVTAVHAGYAKRRKDLLAAGVELYESRRQDGEKQRNESAGPFGSSGSSLHAKTFAVDRQHFFVGSYNFDPRSAHLNTELGFLIESPVLAQRIEAAFNGAIPKNSYEVRLSDTGELYWLEQREGHTIRHDREPETGFWKQAFVRFLALLPIEWLL